MDANRAFIMGIIEGVPLLIPDAARLESTNIVPYFRNYGNTPGKILRLRAKIEYLSATEQLPDVPDYAGLPAYTRTFEGEIALPPTKISVQPVQILIEGKTFRNVVNESLRLYVYWEAEYEDMYKGRWSSRACYKFHVPGWNWKTAIASSRSLLATARSAKLSFGESQRILFMPKRKGADYPKLAKYAAMKVSGYPQLFPAKDTHPSTD
jgi:hypothetical protein